VYPSLFRMPRSDESRKYTCTCRSRMCVCLWVCLLGVFNKCVCVYVGGMCEWFVEGESHTSVG